MLFTSAALNFGVNQLLDVLVGLAPPPDGALDVDGNRRAVESPFSAFVFKVQAGGLVAPGSDRHARVVSGTFERGDVLTRHATGKPFVTKYAQSVFGQRAHLDDAWPGDVIRTGQRGRAASGDTLYLRYCPSVSADPELFPEHFAVAATSTPASTSSSGRASNNSTRRWFRCCARTSAVSRRPCSRLGPGPCNSRWPPTGWPPRWCADLVGVTALSGRAHRRPRGRRFMNQ